MSKAGSGSPVVVVRVAVRVVGESTRWQTISARGGLSIRTAVYSSKVPPQSYVHSLPRPTRKMEEIYLLRHFMYSKSFFEPICTIFSGRPLFDIANVSFEIYEMQSPFLSAFNVCLPAIVALWNPLFVRLTIPI